MVARTSKNTESGKIAAFESHLDNIFEDGYAEWLQENDREAYDWYFCEFMETYNTAA